MAKTITVPARIVGILASIALQTEMGATVFGAWRLGAQIDENRVGELIVDADAILVLKVQDAPQLVADNSRQRVSADVR